MKKLVIVICLMLPTWAQAQKTFSSLEEQMTGKDFTASGLHKLSEAELTALNSWISANVSGSVAIGSSTPGQDSRGFENQELRERFGNREPIESEIEGSFSGWSGDTVFKLTNGMVWRQAEAGNFNMRRTENPQVIIKPGAFQTWRLQIVGYGKTIRVERQE